MMKQLMQKLFLSCEEATLLMEKGKDKGLPFGQRAKLSMHIGMCYTCRSYKGLSRKLDQLLGKLFDKKEKEQVEMPENKKQELLKGLEEGRL